MGIDNEGPTIKTEDTCQDEGGMSSWAAEKARGMVQAGWRNRRISSLVSFRRMACQAVEFLL